MFKAQGLNVREQIVNKLYDNGVQQSDIDFIAKLIYQSDKDENFWFTPHNLDGILDKQNSQLKELFHRVSEEAGINWEYTHEDEDEELECHIRK